MAQQSLLGQLKNLLTEARYWLRDKYPLDKNTMKDRTEDQMAAMQIWETDAWSWKAQEALTELVDYASTL